MEKLNIQVTKRKENIVLPEKLGFGKYFTDHLFEMDYNPQDGWHNASIKPLAKMGFHPAAVFIHYGQAAFEGLKAFKRDNGDVVLFRPEDHFKRMNNSCERLCMPKIDIPFVVDALKKLVDIERDWIPAVKGESLYIRPFIFGSDSFLGVKPSSTYKFLIILSPVAAYYPEGFKPVKILVQDDFARAVKKGMGECKTPGNYAASLLAEEFAVKKGFTQVLWLDGNEQKYVDEVGTMNFFVRFKNEVATPALNGGILHGVTRKSVVQILKDWNVPVSERLIPIKEIVDGYKSGEVLSAFGTGTAAIISAIGQLTFKDTDMIFNNNEPDDLEIKLFEEITAIQRGTRPDTHNWTVPVPKEF